MDIVNIKEKIVFLEGALRILIITFIDSVSLRSQGKYFSGFLVYMITHSK